MLLAANHSYEQLSRCEADEVLRLYDSNAKKGLSKEDIQQRLKQFGPNIFRIAKKKSEWLELLSHFKSPLIIILLAASIISFSLSETINATIIIAIVLVSVIIDYLQEKDARNAAEKLKQTVKTRVTVLRNETEKEITQEELCPGDIILLNAGKIVPADSRVFFAKDFFVNQSSLTGESFPCEKHSEPIPNATAELSALNNIAFMGSSVISGTAGAVVVRTGRSTEFGRIAEKLVNREEETEFSRGMKQFGLLILRITIVLVLFIFLINAVFNRNLLESFMFSLAVAVGLTPELLPMVMSVTMAKGSMRMAKKGVVVKKLTAIQSFGSMEVLCTDKTGTITEDKIRLIKYVDPNGHMSESLFLLAYLNSLFQTGIRNPLDDAILEHKRLNVPSYRKMDEIPFDFVRKRMSVVVTTKESNLLICKGAPEEIFKICAEDQQLLVKANEQYESLSADGFRVLAIATKPVQPKERFSIQDEQQLQFNGFIAFLDPPKEDADETVAELARIGVEVKIITGDNHLVTQKICKEIGLPVKGLLQGNELELLSDDALKQRVLNTTIFTRCSPDQKNRIILALKAYYRAVGYLGDGINDAPSLKTADIGISVNSATDVAKDSADIILTKKDLLVLKEGIIEGRKTFGNNMKYILMVLSSNFGNMFSIAFATLLLPFLPMLPVQILINNFLYDISQTAIPADNVDESYTRLPQHWNLRLIRSYMFIFGFTSSIFDFVTFYLLYNYFSVSEAQFRTGWFMESLATQILVVFIIRTNDLPFIRSKPAKVLVLSTLTCLAIGWILPYSQFGGMIGFEPLPANVILFITGIVLTYLFCAELVKRFIYHRFYNQAGRKTRDR